MERNLFDLDPSDGSFEALEAELQQSIDRLIDKGRCGDDHREQAAAFRRRLANVRARLEAQREAARRVSTSSPEVRGDFELLNFDLRRWFAQIDDDFKAGAPNALSPPQTAGSSAP